MTARIQEIGWILNHLDDLDADFLRYYRQDWRTLDGPRFFSLAERVVTYGGVIYWRAVKAVQEEPEPVVRLAELAGDDLIEVG